MNCKRNKKELQHRFS